LSDKYDTIYHYDVKFEPSELKPAKVSWKIIEVWSQTYSKDLGGIRPVFDGKANLYTARPLPHKQVSFPVNLKIRPDDREEKQYKVTVCLANNILVQDLNNALAGCIQSCPAVVIQALDIVMRMTARVTLTAIGRSIFGSGECQPLGQGRELWFGYYQSVRPNMWAVDLTVDVSATVFYEERPVVEFMIEVLNLRDINDWDPRRREIFASEVRGLQVIPTHLSYERKYRVVDVTSEPSENLRFPLDQEDGTTIQCTVAKYFQKKYKQLRYPWLPCLQMEPKEKKRYFPIEVNN
jgi:eukaryotic translation initiation factor 2C